LLPVFWIIVHVYFNYIPICHIMTIRCITNANQQCESELKNSAVIHETDPWHITSSRRFISNRLTHRNAWIISQNPCFTAYFITWLIN